MRHLVEGKEDHEAWVPQRRSTAYREETSPVLSEQKCMGPRSASSESALHRELLKLVSLPNTTPLGMSLQVMGEIFKF